MKVYRDTCLRMLGGAGISRPTNSKGMFTKFERFLEILALGLARLSSRISVIVSGPRPNHIKDESMMITIRVHLGVCDSGLQL